MSNVQSLVDAVAEQLSAVNADAIAGGTYDTVSDNDRTIKVTTTPANAEDFKYARSVAKAYGSEFNYDVRQVQDVKEPLVTATITIPEQLAKSNNLPDIIADIKRETARIHERFALNAAQELAVPGSIRTEALPPNSRIIDGVYTPVTVGAVR